MQGNEFRPAEIIQFITPEITFRKIGQTIQNNLEGSQNMPSSAFYKLTLKLPIDCHCNKERNFIQQLVITLTQSPHFEYLVHLSPYPKVSLSQTLSKYSSTYCITYCSFQFIDSQIDRRLQIEATFKERSQKVHNILMGLIGKYRFETKLTFWVKRFNELLKQFELREVKEKGKLSQKNQSLYELMQQAQVQLKQQFDWAVRKQ